MQRNPVSLRTPEYTLYLNRLFSHFHFLKYEVTHISDKDSLGCQNYCESPAS